MKLLAILIGLVAFNETAPLYIHIYMASNTRIVVMISLDQNKFWYFNSNFIMSYSREFIAYYDSFVMKVLWVMSMLS